MVILVIVAVIGVGFAVFRYKVLDAVLPTEMIAALNLSLIHISEPTRRS